MVDYSGYELFEQDNVSKNLIIEGNGFRYTNSDIDSESFELYESLCSENTLKFGVCESAYVKFRIGYGAQSLEGERITISMQLSGAQDIMPIGVYTITSDTLSADKRYRDIVAYDALNAVLKKNVSDWYNSILPDMTSSVTVKQFRDSFFEYLNIYQEETTLINDDISINKTIEYDGITGKDILESICEMNACFGHMTRGGTFRYVYLDQLTSASAIVIGDDKTYTSVTYEDFVTEPLTKLQIRQEENDIGVIVGSGSNDYVIEGNPLLFGKDQSELTTIGNNILAKISIASYRPCKIEVKGNPCIEAGDGIQVVTTYNTVMTYVLQRTMKGVQSLKDTIKATGTKVFNNNNNSIHSQLIQLRGKSNTLERTIDETRSELVDMDAETRTIITQTADTLQIQINELYAEVDGDINLYYTQETPTLLNYPAWDFTYNIPCNDTVQLADDLAFEYNDTYYKKNLRSIAYDETDNITYRFIKSSGQWIWQEVSNTETTLILSRLSQVEATAESLSSEVSELSLTLDNDYYTISETQSAISQTSSSILATVSGTYTTKTTTQTLAGRVELKLNTSDLVSEFNAKANVITLTSDYFTLAANGTITATGGTIGGWNFNSNSIYSTNQNIVLNSAGSMVGSSGGSKVWQIDSAGTASFQKLNIGANGARIGATLDLDQGTMSGGFYIGSSCLYSGMTSLTDTTHNGIYLGTTGIALGKGAFKVTSAGALTATNANITGAISTSNLTATGGMIGGWSIGTDALKVTKSYSGTTYTLELGSTQNVGVPLLLHQNGDAKAFISGAGLIYATLLYAGDANIEGIIRSDSIETLSLSASTISSSSNISASGYVSSGSLVRQTQNGGTKYCIGSPSNLEFRYVSSGNYITVFLNGTSVGRIYLSTT